MRFRVAYPPKEASPPDIAYIRMAIEVFVQECFEKESALADVRDKVILPDDALDFQGRRAADRVSLVSVSVGKSTSKQVNFSSKSLGPNYIPGPALECVGHSVVDQDRSDRRIAAAQPLGQGFNIGHHAFVLPRVQRSAAAHP